MLPTVLIILDKEIVKNVLSIIGNQAKTKEYASLVSVNSFNMISKQVKEYVFDMRIGILEAMSYNKQALFKFNIVYITVQKALIAKIRENA